jgi:hypothetical protein
MDAEVEKLREAYERAMNGIIKAEHIIEAFLEIASPQSRPYAEVLLKALREAKSETEESK